MGATQQRHGISKPGWAENALRLDPYSLPQRVQRQPHSEFLQTGARRAPSSSQGIGEAAGLEFTLNRGGAVLKGALPCGLPLSLALPAKAFRGVAARAWENDDGTMTVTLELLHADPQLSVPLCVSDTVEETAADWHSWAKRFGLPMLLIDEAGEAQTVRDYAGITSQAVKPRRMRSSPVKHRPQFLRRRRTGMIGPVVRLDAQEIIARS
ncbi:MAG: DUF6101 family protein [Pseudomonadota bacterium]